MNKGIVTAAQYQKGFVGSGNVNIKATINGKTVYVPLRADNTEYQIILEWVADGNTIAEAD
tara:strand:+ start:1058 stop:1240 length:183 start_codon:yes stop_codon:yes gene_type:complete